MSQKAFFATNVLIYVVGQKDERTAKAERLVASGGVINVQVLDELASVSRRKLRMCWEEIGDALAAIRILCPSPIPLTVDAHDAGLRIAKKYGLPHLRCPDCGPRAERRLRDALLRRLPG
jgi:predicted nucleic acid-binding protein